jgi:hypothetical protein
MQSEISNCLTDELRSVSAVELCVAAAQMLTLVC